MKFSKKAKALIVAGFIAVGTATPAQAVDLPGSGASFVDPLLQECKAGFNKATNHSYVYTSTGSSTGVKNSDAKIGDFWFSDVAHTAATKRSTVFHAPIVAAPIAVLVNLPAKKDIYLSSTTVAKIFAGQITKWNDPEIVADNNRSVKTVVYKKTASGNVAVDKSGKPIVLRSGTKNIYYTLPNKPIKVVYRSDSSGTTENFTNYLNKSAPTVWTKAKAAVFTTSFPGNINSPENLGRIVGAASSTGVSQLAGKTPYSITFAEVNYAVANRLKVAHVINNAGNAVEPNSVTTSAFLSQASIDANGIMSFDYATKEAGAYTLGIVSYMLADTSYPDKNKAAAVKSLATFLLSPACAKDKGASLGFSVIDGAFLKKAQELVAKIG